MNLLPLQTHEVQRTFQDLKKDGWFEVRQAGSHVMMKHPTKPNIIPVPYHGSKEVKKGLLRSI
jgi:predicted RNA binding protein YcfA (HicA-like mRNA interferase family)